MPDLERSAFNELGTGGMARRDSESLGITPFFGHISKLAGIQGRTLLATDIANTNLYTLFGYASKTKEDFRMGIVEEQKKLVAFLTAMLTLSLSRPPEVLSRNRYFDETGYTYEYGNIMPWEYQLHTTNDARHLITARGLMQEALTTDENEILSVWAPKHAERIDDYIKKTKRI